MFNKQLFDVISFYMIEADKAHVSVHAYKLPYMCVKFIIPVELMNSPDLWIRCYEMATELWMEKDDFPACPNCGATRRNWKRSYKGQEFCGVCSHAI